jgi:hypothetical protein
MAVYENQKWYVSGAANYAGKYVLAQKIRYMISYKELAV